MDAIGIRSRLRTRNGQTMAEYGLILALIFLTAVIGVAALATVLSGSIGSTVARITSIL